MISVQTNVTSLIAQETLRVDSNFQSRTIQRLTSGYRINSSGDDPAGLAVANGYRNSEAELPQGIQNANDGISTLQIIDGGENNIGQILDRLKTLATQSASDTFTGNRNVLNSEFQGLVTEINRQAQAIGLDQNGTFARNLSVYIGGGRAQGTTTAATNSSLQFNLSGATVDAKSLGLTGMQALGGTTGVTDIGSGSAKTSVAAILSDANNNNTGMTNFYISGPGFSGAEKVKVAVNTQNVTDTGTLITAINKGIQNAGNNGTAAGTALQDANITATINTDSSGKQQLAFTSSTTAFQVEAGDLVSNALMGKFVDATTNADAAAMTSTVTGGENVTLANAITNPANITMRFTGAGLSAPVDITLQSSDSTVAAAVSDLQTQMASKLAGTGITLATPAATGQTLSFSSARGEKFAVSVSGDATDALGLGSFQKGLNGVFDYSTLAATANYDPTAATTAGTSSLQFSINGAASSAVNVDLAGGNATYATSTGTALAGATTTITAGTNMFSLAVDGVVSNVTLTSGVAATKGTAAAGSVSFGVGGASTFSVVAATSAQVQGTVIAGTVDTTLANQFLVNIDGTGNQTINLVAATGQTQASIANQITAQLGGRATAAFVSNKLTITSATAGLSSGVKISAGAAGGLGTGDATTLLGLTDLTQHNGVAGNNIVNVSVDGGPTTAITLTAGAARTGLQIEGDLNGAGLGTIASLDGSNHLVLASTTTGVGSSILISAPAANSADTLIGITAAEGTVYHGAAATSTQTLDSLASTIQTAIGAGNATVSVSPTNQIQIKAATAGQGHTIEILNGTANTALGFNGQEGTVRTGQNRSGADLAAALQQQFNTTADLKAAGLTATYASNKITVTGNGTYFRVNANAASTNAVALGTQTVANGGTFDFTGANTLSINNHVVTLTNGTMTAAAVQAAITSADGVTSSVVTQNGRDSLKLVSTGTAGSSDAISITGNAAAVLGLATGTTAASGTDGSFGFGIGSGVSFAGATVGVAHNSVVNAGGSSATGDLAFTPLAYGSDSQVITVTANDSSGATQPMTITLSNNGATRTGRSLDETVEAINTALQQTNNSTLQKITAVKDVSPAGAEKINFVSSLASFQVSVGSTASGNGIGSQGTTVNSQALAGGSSLDISTQQGGTSAISALTTAVSALGSAQANVGKAQNTLNYAIGLAESQTSNLSAAQSRIRDADMASEAANLTKAQVLQQSAIAAMVQANSAPQAVLTLLRG